MGCGQGKYCELRAYWQKQRYLKKNGNLGTGVLIYSQHLSLTWEMPGEKLESPQACLSPPLNTSLSSQEKYWEERKKNTVSSNLNSSQFYPVYSVLQNVLGYQLSHSCRSNSLTSQYQSICEENKLLGISKRCLWGFLSFFGWFVLFFPLMVVFFLVIYDNTLLISVISMCIW